MKSYDFGLFLPKSGFEVTIDLDFLLEAMIFANFDLKVIIFAYFGLKVAFKQQFP